MLRHLIGEDLNVGCVLSWGPCWYYQKEFFDGKVHPLSTAHNVLRYDVEVSGFPSSFCGHLSLLRLREDDYTGARRIEDWPSWDLPVLRWAQAQGAVAGFSHSGWGLQVSCQELPCFEMPPFDCIGANEYIVDVAHGAVDFISAVDTPAVWELSIWYHTLNCGFRTRLSGEIDFPCIYGERVGLGRSCVFTVGGVAVGEIRALAFEVELERSSWVALRIFPSSHRNPVFVEVGGKPIRASRRSARWCLEAVGVCWDQKHSGIRDSERAAAAEAYGAAREVYRKILGECEVD
jgi:hypothetical protein